MQAKLSLRLEYIPPKPGKGVEGEIAATDETDLGAELDDEFGLEDEEGVDELEGGGAEGVGEAVGYRTIVFMVLKGKFLSSHKFVTM